MVCISASSCLACKFIQESKSTSSYSEHTTYSELLDNRSLLWLLLNRSVKCITTGMLTEDTIKLLSLFHNSNFSKQVSHICTLHTPSHPSILDRCVHVQVSTTIVQVTSAHLQVSTTFFMYLHQVSVSTGHFHSPARCIYNYNLYPWVFTNYLKLPITQI